MKELKEIMNQNGMKYTIHIISSFLPIGKTETENHILMQNDIENIVIYNGFCYKENDFKNNKFDIYKYSGTIKAYPQRYLREHVFEKTLIHVLFEIKDGQLKDVYYKFKG